MQNIVSKTAVEIIEQKLILNRWGGAVSQTYIIELTKKGKLVKEAKGNKYYYSTPPNNENN